MLDADGGEEKTETISSSAEAAINSHFLRARDIPTCYSKAYRTQRKGGWAVRTDRKVTVTGRDGGGRFTTQTRQEADGDGGKHREAAAGRAAAAATAVLREN